jgi:adenylate cyclase class 2
MLEREVKLRFDSPEQARAAITAAHAILLRPRRLQHDVLFDTADAQLRREGCALRVRHENGTGVITFKGAVVPAAMKLRAEYETAIASPDAMRQVLEGLGFRPWFTYEKYREEYALPGVVVAVDETPIGTFVEIEGGESEILAATRQLGRTPQHFVLGSYRTLFVESAAGRASSDMVFVTG